MSTTERKRQLYLTPPLHDEEPAQPFHADPTLVLSQYAPPSADLKALANRAELPTAAEAISGVPRPPRQTLPPGAPEWMRAARMLADALEESIAAGEIDTVQHAAVARAWAAYALGGVKPRQVLKVAHLVSRAHRAIRDTQREQLDIAYRDCADIVFRGLPSEVRSRMPFERVMLLVRSLRHEADAWAAVVEGTCELLGWKDYARSHAAAVIRAVIEKSR
jgi:hypothetical protein